MQMFTCRIGFKLQTPAKGLPLLEAGTSDIEGMGLHLTSQVATGSTLLRALVPSVGWEVCGEDYDPKKHIMHKDNTGVMMLLWPDLGTENDVCVNQRSRAAACSLSHHTNDPNCDLVWSEVSKPKWDRTDRYVWYELTLFSLLDLSPGVELTIAYQCAPPAIDVVN